MPASHDLAYLRLARNRNFSLLWFGQRISFFGDRLHQVAIGVLVLQATGSPAAVALVWAATFTPTILLGPLAGVAIDRWPHRRTMIIADLARAGLVLAVPLSLAWHPLAVYPLTALLATASIFFRPAKVAALPLVIEERDLVKGNAAHSLSETLADLLGYPAAGLLVALLADNLIVAFWLDAGSYLISAACIAGMSIPAVRRLSGPWQWGNLSRELQEGWYFLWRQTELAANTVISIVAQLAVGAHIGLSLVYAERVLDHDVLAYPENYALMMAAVGLGSLIGGVLVGIWGDQIGKGRLALINFALFGVTLLALGLVSNPFVAIGLSALLGAANMGFLIPNMALFQERVPPELMGRVIATRIALVVSAMVLAMVAGGILAESIGTPAVFISVGGLAALAAVAGVFLPAMRNAR